MQACLIVLIMLSALGVVFDILGVCDGDAMLLAVTEDQNLNHVGDGAMLVLRCSSQCVFQTRVDPKGQRGCLGGAHSPCSPPANVLQCTLIHFGTRSSLAWSYPAFVDG